MIGLAAVAYLQALFYSRLPATEVLHVKKLGPIKIFAVNLDTWRPYGDMKFINL